MLPKQSFSSLICEIQVLGRSAIYYSVPLIYRIHFLTYHMSVLIFFSFLQLLLLIWKSETRMLSNKRRGKEKCPPLKYLKEGIPASLKLEKENSQNSQFFCSAFISLQRERSIKVMFETHCFKRMFEIRKII